MSRPCDPSKYTDGPSCPRCSGTLYRRKTVCVECERRANARRYAERTGIDYVEPAPVKFSPAKLATELDGYRRSPSARERGARLDALVLGKPLDQGEAAPLTAGDVWRSMLPIGVSAKPLPHYAAQAGERHAQNAALTKAIRRILPRLPDIASIDEIRRLLPPDAVEPINASRLPWAIAAALAELGIVPGKGSGSKTGGRMRLYVVRHKRRYAGLSIYALEQVKAGTRPPAASGRSSKSKIQGDAPGNRTATQRPSMGQREASSRPPVTDCDNKGIPTGDRCLMVRPLSARPGA